MTSFEAHVQYNLLRVSPPPHFFSRPVSYETYLVYNVRLKEMGEIPDLLMLLRS
jgi:hypothetical protein